MGREEKNERLEQGVWRWSQVTSQSSQGSLLLWTGQLKTEPENYLKRTAPDKGPAVGKYIYIQGAEVGLMRLVREPCKEISGLSQV